MACFSTVGLWWYDATTAALLNCGAWLTSLLYGVLS